MKLKAEIKKTVGRKALFIDPASISAGWAFFVDGRFVATGTVCARKSDNQFRRLVAIYQGFEKVYERYKPEDVHIEQLNYGVQYACLWSVGVIGFLFASRNVMVAQDIPVTSWQSACNWKSIKEQWIKNQDFSSEDAFAAYQMGRWFVGEYYNHEES